ncbi:MAG: energy-coupling factor transporter transmembrane protein EcfT [Firmicutes bacterium]|nr:energy-coupling factor transporter transmembrane protein EcfT [Bacillota bacterium]
MRDISFGQYYAAESVVHRLDPRLKLILTIAYMVLVFFIQTFFGFGILFVFVLAVTFSARIPPLRLLRSLRTILILLLFTISITLLFYHNSAETPIAEWWIFSFYRSGFINSGLLACRLVLLIIGPTLLTLTTTPVSLTDAIESLLKPLSWIKIPVHAFAMIMSIALRLIPTLSEETHKIIAAQKARGANFDSRNPFKRAKALIPILIPLFVSSFRRADELAYAMDSRCYKGAKGRTRMKVMRFAWRDLFAFLVFGALFFGILLLRYNWWNWDWVRLITQW